MSMNMHKFHLVDFLMYPSGSILDISKWDPEHRFTLYFDQGRVPSHILPVNGPGDPLCVCSWCGASVHAFW